MLTSLRRWPGVPSFSESACGVVDSACERDCARNLQDASSNSQDASSNLRGQDSTAWPQEFEVEIELGHEEWSTSVAHSASSHASSRNVSAPQPGVTHDVYAAILHHLPSLVVALLKLLLAAGAM
jgi:hypothetical protein